MYLFSLGSESPKGAIGHIVPTEKTILAVEKNKMLLPPLWNRTFSWGFDDFSCCLGSYGSDKVGDRGLDSLQVDFRLVKHTVTFSARSGHRAIQGLSSNPHVLSVWVGVPGLLPPQPPLT